MSLRITFVTLFFVALLTSCAYHKAYVNSYIENPEHEIIFTTGLDEYQEAINSLTEVSMDIDELYVFVRWKNIPRFSFNFRYMVYDAQGTLVTLSNFEAKRGKGYNLRTWLTYSFDTTNDAPGTWKLELYLNDKLVSENLFKVKRH